MKAIVVRDKGTGAVVAMGPDNGMYDPGYDQATMVKDVKSDYAAVYAEWRQANPTLAAELDAGVAKTVPGSGRISAP